MGLFPSRSGVLPVRHGPMGGQLQDSAFVTKHRKAKGFSGISGSRLAHAGFKVSGVWTGSGMNACERYGLLSLDARRVVLAPELQMFRGLAPNCR
jgi:hypothetical protein